MLIYLDVSDLVADLDDDEDLRIEVDGIELDDDDDPEDKTPRNGSGDA